ncbi:hypothetical protein [Flavobacterium sp. 22076]|uniref:hypothetical protein n=1 Tax=unclassified Flavobacterium TaxID=196869 RepID=UPI003F843E1D
MKVELVPVIEIFNTDQNIEWPDVSPSWEYQDEWAEYFRLTSIAAGFSDTLKPYSKGSSFYRIDEISDEDLLNAIQREIKIQQTEENKGIEDLTCSFSGGYILKLNDESVYFPQCCCCLADIKMWEGLIIGKTKFFYPGHPFPRVTERDNKIHFDFIDIEVREKFAPPFLYNILELKKSELEFAIKETNKVLEVFANRLKLINQTEKINITNIDKILIWGES